MNTTASALLRFSAAGGLWLLIAVLILPSLVMHWLSGAGLFVIAELKAKADDLIAAARQ